MLTLPFLLIRVIYFLLQEYGPSEFNPASGSVGILAGMGLLMEIIIIGIFFLARTVIEPLSGSSKNKRNVTSNDAEWAGN
jgi:hypothetical protein